jgi:AraC family transcriptional regulator of adaptative response / DNA-3-methyladenine glycosylase II
MRNSIEALANGFRPCLICRPDRLPDFGMGYSDPEIAHAVRLIAEGFLDDARTEELASRVGYSSRHLVRLFEKHIGASPDFVARARRAHLARRLLDESDLPITKVAFAAGFSSLRQMNRVMRELFAFSPSELRSKRRKYDAFDPLDGGLKLRVPFEGELDVQRTIRYLESRAIPTVETVERETYKRTMNTCGHPGVVEICSSNAKKNKVSASDQLEVSLHLATFGSIIEQLERVRALFGINLEHTAAITHLSQDRLLGRLVRTQPGVRMPGAWDRFETSIRIIVGQQISLAGASTLTGRLAQRFGTACDVGLPDSLSQIFPGAKALAAADGRDWGMPQSRVNTIRRFSAAVASGELDLGAVDSLDETVKRLEALPGIGPWTSQFIAGRVMGHQDAFPAGDLGLRKSAARLVGKLKPLTTKELTELAESWRPFRRVASSFLWMAQIK